MLGVQLLTAILSLGLLIPSIGVGVRRLHDLDKSGWWLLLSFVPIIGAIVLIYWFCQPGTPGQTSSARRLSDEPLLEKGIRTERPRGPILSAEIRLAG